MTRNFFWVLFVTVLLGVGLQSCQSENHQISYENALLEAPLKAGEAQDIFLGLQLAVRPKVFFDHCTELNKARKIDLGNVGTSVRYEFQEDLNHPAIMNFYPDFTKPDLASGDSSLLYAMDFAVSYAAWAPWNKEQGSDKLIVDLAKQFETWYGGDFWLLDNDKVGKLLTMVTANRRTTLYILDQSHVRGRIVDLSLAPEDPLLPANYLQLAL